MTETTAPRPTAVLVHGAFAESASWAGVAAALGTAGVDVVAAANPLRSVAGDAAYLADVVRGLGRPVVLVGHSYGGMVVTEAAAALEAVTALVYVGAFVPERGESALELSGRFPGSTLGETLLPYPLAGGGEEFRIDPVHFPAQFAADVPAELAATMALTQRPVTAEALGGALSVEPAWRRLPTWSVYGDADRNVPPAAQAAMAERAGVRGLTVVPGGSHAVAVSHPGAVAALESVAFQTRDLWEAMRKDWPSAGRAVLRVDGGMTASDWTMQRISDLLGAPVDRPVVRETTALGAAWLAGFATGVVPGPEGFAEGWALDRRFEPAMAAEERARRLALWDDAVARTLTRR